MTDFKKCKIDGQWWIIRGTNRFCRCADENEATFTLTQLDKGENGIVSGCDTNFYVMEAIAATRGAKNPHR